MANYNCTPLGCIQDPLGTYPDLQSCQSACVGWGCPPQLTTNTNIIFAYDGSGSYGSSQARLGMFKSATAWTETLAQAGWVGTADHTIMGYQTSTTSNPIDVTTPSGTVTLSGWVNWAEDWLTHGLIPYILTNQVNGVRNASTSLWQMLSTGSDLEIPINVQSQYFSNYDRRPNMAVTGATYPSVPTLVVSFCHQSSNYRYTNPRYQMEYDLWSKLYDNAPNPDYMKAFLFPVKNECQSATWWYTLQQTLTFGVQAILKGNQDDVANGGTGTLDGTWITYPTGSMMPNGSICPPGNFGAQGGCTTAPLGPATQTPCVQGPWAPCGANGATGQFCYWSETLPVDSNGIAIPGTWYTWAASASADLSVNGFWVGGSPTWGGLEDKGWGINVSLLGTDSALLSTALNDSVGTVATPATICISAETDYTTSTDYPYPDLLACNSVCFPLLDPWLCPQDGTPCIQDPTGTFPFGPGTPYATVDDAYTACTAQCQNVTAYTCSNYGCVEDVDGIFPSLSACTAQCQSYSCTTNGCYGPFVGTGNTGTYLEMSSCTATCYHFECVTSSYAASGILPNDYNSASSGTTNGCLQLPGSGGTSPNALGFNEYTTLSACTASCVSWQCCEPLSIGPDSVMYVYYDITSMDATQTQNAIKGIIDWTENHLEFTGHTYHMLWWSERWLAFPTVAYDMDVYRFTDGVPSSYLTDPNNLAAGISYDAPAIWGYMGFGQSSSAYWTSSTSKPVQALRDVYHPTTGFDSWITPGTYNGNATHTVHDSFSPGSTSPTWTNGQVTKGYGGVMTASTSDDVITIIFEDESVSQYHYQGNGTSFGNEPHQTYKDDHTRYFAIHDAVTATTQGGGTGGNIRSFLYPTVTTLGGSNTAAQGFALHSIAAIDSGTNSPLDGKWTSATYPLDNNAYGYVQPWTHAQCSVITQLSILVSQNPYWTGTVPTWGGLDQYGWSINFRFDIYDQTIFEEDLTSFMTGSSQACTTICTSGHTALDAEFPYSSQTLCEGLVGLGECTGCTKFNCGPNGCYTAATGEFDCLSDCTASCYSYSCTTTGCTDHNPPTGTTFPYTSTDGVSYYSYYGSGGTFSSNTDCELVCNSWECGPGGCYMQTNGTGGTYSSETHCQLECSGYNCDQQFGCIPEIGNDYEYATLLECQTGCTYWECDVVLGCISKTGVTTGSIYEFQSQTACTNYCASFNCGVNGCYELNNLSGTYQDITLLPIISSAACTASCISFNCGTSGCSEVTGTGGTYSTSASCTGNCVSYSCGTDSNPGCNLWNVPNYGTGGTWTSVIDCDNNCISWECGSEALGDLYNGTPTGCLPQSYTGGSFSSLTHCLEEGYDYLSPDYTNTGNCTTWDCSATGCIPLTGTGGQFVSLSSCTGVCTSYECIPGTATKPEGGQIWTGGGCTLYNSPNYGTGGTFLYEWQCSGECRSWDCTSTGCTEVSAGAGSGATYLTALACDSGCTSYNCGDTGCTSQVGSGGTFFSSTNPDWGVTACTATCISYDCGIPGCYQYNQQLGGGSGGTFYNATASISALTACTAACISYECTTGGCSDIQGTGATNSFSAESACTATCINWGCLNNPIETNCEIYAYYDTTSMDFNAVKTAITGLEDWITTIQNFTGGLYHTLVNDERWLSWASSVYHSEFTAGTSSIFQNPTAMMIHDWASGLSMTNVYDNMAPGNSTFLFPGITTTGPAPAASHTDCVLVITFIDESGPNNGLGTTNVYTSDDAGSVNNAIPNFAGILSNPLDQPTPTWKVDFTAYSATYATVTTAGGSLNCFMYPTESFQPQSPDNELFALHVVAAIDSGNQAVGTQGENWLPGTAPRRLISGGILGGVPELCSIADLTALEVSNPYLLSVDSYTPNVGNLDTKGWGYNINFGSYTPGGFNSDLSTFLNTVSSNLTLCVSANTIPTIEYPFPTQSACTADCYSYECTFNGCVEFNGTGGTPTYYPTLLECESACTSWNCTTTACTVQVGTGGTWLSSGACTTACTSFNCEDITTYTPSVSWPIANGCIEQTGSGGTFYGAAAGSSGSSIFGWSACTADCQSWNCLVNCTGGTTGCTAWPNTAATYTALTSCTASCSIDWYCTEAYEMDTCDGLTDTTYVDMNFYGSGIPYFSDNPGNHTLTFANYKFTRILDPTLQASYTTPCVSPWNASHYQGPLPTSIDPSQPYLPSTLGRYSYIQYLEIYDTTSPIPYPGNVISGPHINWSSTIAGILGISDQCLQTQGLSTSSSWLDVHAALVSCNYNLHATYNWCTCYEVPCDVFCDDGNVTIPVTAQGPFTTSGAAESACCVSVTYSCITGTEIDSCSGRTTLPGQFNSTTDAWDWLAVNLGNTDLTTLRYESTTPAVNVSGACAGPNGGVLYEIAPVTYSLLNPNVSYNTWNLFINQMQGAGTTGILSGMSYTDVNTYVYAQSGQTIQVCDEICHCSVIPCECIELYDGTGQYLTHEDCMSGTSTLAACCPNTGTTGTSWDCVSGITYLPICDTKPYIGNFNDQFATVDYFRVGNPTGIFGQHKYTASNVIDNNGTSSVVIPNTWAEVQSSTNPGYTWQSCYKEFSLTLWIAATVAYRPYKHIKSISHPAVTGGLEYTNWNAFYTAAAGAFTLTTSLDALQVCQSIDSQYWGSNNFGCVVDTMKCCNQEDCYCYETFTTGGTYFTEIQCLDPLTGCCPEYTGWTCEVVDPITLAVTTSLPCYFISQSSPIMLYHTIDTPLNIPLGGAQWECDQNFSYCDPVPVGEMWSCVTTQVNTCDPNGDSLGEITGTTLGPNMVQTDFTYGQVPGYQLHPSMLCDNPTYPLAGTCHTQYPFSSSTDQFWPLLQSTSLAIGAYLGGYGQVESILTDYHYYDPYTPLSSTTFQLGSVDILGTSLINPNDPSCVYPLPYTVPPETCMGINATGGTGMPLFSILSVAHRDINYNTPYGSWGEFIDAAILLGYSVNTNHNVDQLGQLYPLTFGCDEDIITTQTSTTGAAWYSGCGWSFDMVPCLCDITCCCETGFTQGFITEEECLDPVNGCCPELSSYTCTINGCIDPGNGSGEFTGLTAYAQCEAVCKEWKCISSTTVTDTCASKTIIPSLGNIDITEYTPSYNTLTRGPWDALAYLADPMNGLQGQTWDNYKWDCGEGCGWAVDDCDAPHGAYKFISTINILDPAPSGGWYCQNCGSVSNWADLISWMNLNIGGGTALFNLGQDYNQVAQTLWNGIPGTNFNGGLELVPQIGACSCIPGPCDCVLTGGTGHSGTYHLVTGQTQCEWDCCSGVTIPECSILITGKEEGVLYYQFDTNSTTKLFDTPPYERLDIAARQNKLWVYADTGAAYEIKEFDVVYYPYFQHLFNRDITVPAIAMGRGLTPTEDPNILLTANDKVYKIDITTTVAVPTLQFPLPSGLTCTGDIMYDHITGNMIITYGTGATQYVGKFDGGGNLLEESHINSTTPGIGVNESIDSLFNYGTWSPVIVNQQYWNGNTGPIYGITNQRRVIELLQTPTLQFAPVATQTLTLVNQISNEVHGATNIFNIINGQLKSCVDITGTTSIDDVYWCDGMLGCLPYPPNVTPPNSFGPHIDLLTCENHCNFVCGDCVQSCECTLVTTPIGSGCNPEPTMADCISQNLANPTTVYGGEGCCNCFACQSVTFTYYEPTAGVWTQQTVNTNINTWGTFASAWSPIIYSVGDVVMYTDPLGNTCCYTLVYHHYDETQTPYDAWTEYSTNLANGNPTWPGGSNEISWIVCDEDCPTIITWSCITGTTVVSNDTCGGAVDTGTGGLSFTPQIQYIAYNGYALWHTQFEDLKWDCGSQQNPLPGNPCPAMVGHWAKIIGCRITHVSGALATPSQGVIQTTWADFIDQINGLLGGSVYSFAYSDRWQDLEAILGSQSYDGSPVPGNAVDIECLWEYCECNPTLPSPLVDGCDDKSDITNTMSAWQTANGMWWQMTVNYFTTPGQPQYNTLADPNSGDIISNYKYEQPDFPGSQNPCYGPLGGIYRYVNKFGITGCRTRHAVQTAAQAQNGHVNYGQFVDFWNNQGMLGTADELYYSDPYTTNFTKVEDWCGTGPDPDNGNNNAIGGSAICNCTYPPTPSYEPCHCEPIYGPGGYPTSAICEEICCSGDTSWSCNTGTTIAWEDSVDCGTRPYHLPSLVTTSTATDNISPTGQLANPANGLQQTLLSQLKFAAGTVNNVAVAAFGIGQFPNECWDVEEVAVVYGPDSAWRTIGEVKIMLFQSTQPPTPATVIQSTVSWKDLITQLSSPPHNFSVNLSMTAQQVVNTINAQTTQLVQVQLGYSVNMCTCPPTPCGCTEIPGTLGYPTSASCEAVCCPITAGTLYDCTINGCIPSSNGTYSNLTHCEEVCKEWICDEDGDCIGSCDMGGNNTPRTAYPLWLFGTPEDLLPYLASPATIPLQSPLLPPIVGNMQNADVTYYKFDCINCSSAAIQTCPSPNGTYWAPSGMWIENTPNASPMVYSGPHYTWQEVVNAAVTQGFIVNNNTSYDDFRTELSLLERQVVIKGNPCYGSPTGCDCVPIPGTGHTGGWEYTTGNYHPCVSACCSGDTFDCTLYGCVPNMTNSGQYLSMSSCTEDCKEWECIPGINFTNSCSGQTLLNIDWTSTPLGTNGFFDQKQLSYIADSANGLQFQDVTQYKWFNQNGPVSNSNSYCTHPFTSGNTTMQFDLRPFLAIVTTNNSFSQNNAVFTNADNYNPSTLACDSTGCRFSTWAQLVTGCNIMGVTDWFGNPITLSNTYMEVRSAISSHWGIVGSILRLYSNACLCYGNACSCLTVAGTGHTGNYYTDFNSCNIAANANPCCTLPTDYWYCQPGLNTQNGLQGNCTCIQGITAGQPGAYPTLADCKASTGNCCDNHWYDCLDQGTPQAGCVGLANNAVGQYQTYIDCYHDCDKLGYNCEIVDDGPGNSGPGGSGYLSCVPCVGITCQYTYLTAAGAPYYGDPLAQCQDSCPGKDCWKCCMDKNGWITQLSPALSPIQCVCPKGTVEVQCDGSGPCPHPVSCIPGYVYNWTYCKCVCEPNMSCAPGYHWSYDACTCVPNIIGPVDFVGSQGEVLQSMANFKHQPGERPIINEFIKGVQLLEYMTTKGYYLGSDECSHCTDGTQGICVLDGCLYFPNYEKYGNKYIGWKSLLVTGSDPQLTTVTPTIGPPTTPILTGATLQGYSCIDDPTNPPNYTNCVMYGTSQYVAYYGTAAPQYATLQDCFIAGCDFSGNVQTVGFSCVDNPDNPPTYTECLEYGTAPYLAYFGNAAPQYSTLQDCFMAGCDFSGSVYYQCTVETNPLVGESQQSCIPVDGVSGPGLFTSLEDCLNSGCAGWMACDQTKVTQVNGIGIEANSIYPIPMCCESYINSATIPLTVENCQSNCSNMSEPWFPLYNVIGINTYYESPLGYLMRELNPYVRNGTCAVSLTPDSIGRGRTQRTIYDINY